MESLGSINRKIFFSDSSGSHLAQRYDWNEIWRPGQGQNRVKMPKKWVFFAKFSMSDIWAKIEFFTVLRSLSCQWTRPRAQKQFFSKNSQWVECSNTVKNGFLHIDRACQKCIFFRFFGRKCQKTLSGAVFRALFIAMSVYTCLWGVLWHPEALHVSNLARRSTLHAQHALHANVKNWTFCKFSVLDVKKHYVV